MWGAIKSDLFDFINTITEDTTKTLNKVLGDENEEEEISIQQKLVADLRRSYETYGTPIKESDLKDYEKFKKKFSITSLADDISNVLDEEPEVSRYYTELVPITISPDEFSARLYFRVNQIYRNRGINLDEEDDDEELVWEENEISPEENTIVATTVIHNQEDNNMSMETLATIPRTVDHDHMNKRNISSQTSIIPTTTNSTNTIITPFIEGIEVLSISSVDVYMKERIIQLEHENLLLKTREDDLIQRLQALELLLQKKEDNNNGQVPLSTEELPIPQPIIRNETDVLPLRTIVVEDIHSDDGSIVIINQSDIPFNHNQGLHDNQQHYDTIITESFSNLLHTPSKNQNEDMLITPKDAMDAIVTLDDTVVPLDSHLEDDMLATININTPVISGYYTPAETRIDDDNDDKGYINEANILNKKELFVEQEQLNESSNEVNDNISNNNKDETSKANHYLASLDDDEEEEENGWN